MLRFTIAAIPFAPLLLKSLRDMQILVRGVELGLWVSMAYLAQAVGLLTADAGRSSFISALTVRTLYQELHNNVFPKVYGCITILYSTATGYHCPFLGWSFWGRSTCIYMVWSIFITSWCCYARAKWFSTMCKLDYLQDRLTCLSGPSVYLSYCLWYWALSRLLLYYFCHFTHCFSSLRILKCFKN